jgi:TPR repeat protein
MKALALGNVPARVRLGLLYLDGLGVDRDDGRNIFKGYARRTCRRLLHESSI